MRRSTSPPATPRRSAAPSPRTPAARGCSATARCANRWSAWRPSWRMARSSARSPGSRRRPPGCTGRRWWPARKARWRSSPRRACVSFPASNTPSRRWCRCRRWPAPSICSVTSVVRVPSLDAVEFIQPAALGLVADHLGRRPPVAVPADGTCLVVDCADHDDPTSQLADALAASGGVVDAVVTTDAAQRRELIEFRDRITEAIAAARPPRAAFRRSNSTWRFPSVHSPTCSPSRNRPRPTTARGSSRSGTWPKATPTSTSSSTTDTARLADTVLRAVAEQGGTISAEHGIGVAKAPWLDLIRSPADLAAQRASSTRSTPTASSTPASSPAGCRWSADATAGCPGVPRTDLRCRSRSRGRGR